MSITNYKKNRGFTLMELLVVIALIGILAAIIMAGLRSFREKGADNAIRADLKSVPAQTEIYASEHNFSFAGVCHQGTNSIYDIVMDAAQKAHLSGFMRDQPGAIEQATCNSSVKRWAVEVPLSIPDENDNLLLYCVDSSGFADSTTVPMSYSFNNPSTIKCNTN